MELEVRPAEERRAGSGAERDRREGQRAGAGRARPMDRDPAGPGAPPRCADDPGDEGMGPMASTGRRPPSGRLGGPDRRARCHLRGARRAATRGPGVPRARMPCPSPRFRSPPHLRPDIARAPGRGRFALSSSPGVGSAARAQRAMAPGPLGPTGTMRTARCPDGRNRRSQGTAPEDVSAGLRRSRPTSGVFGDPGPPPVGAGCPSRSRLARLS